jgi:cobalt-zinc-cadmium efflux system outer membrane protein
VFDRNQGNIEAAQARLEQTTAGVALARAAARNDVRSAVNKLRTATELYTATIPLAQTDLPRAMLLVLDAYKQGAIDITQFTDMYSAYKNSMIQMIDVRNAWYQAAVDLNTAVGTDVITLQ